MGQLTLKLFYFLLQVDLVEEQPGHVLAYFLIF